MFERESEWIQFTSFLNVVRPNTDDATQYAKSMRIPVETFHDYLDQKNGRDCVALFGIVPKDLSDHVVGFRYRHLERWVRTNDIEQARIDYDMGLVEVTTGLGKVRGKDAWVLYAIPRREKAVRELYFTAPVLS